MQRQRSSCLQSPHQAVPCKIAAATTAHRLHGVEQCLQRCLPRPEDTFQHGRRQQEMLKRCVEEDVLFPVVNF